MGNSQSNTNADVYNYHESVLKEGAEPVVIGSSDEDSDEETENFFQREGPSQPNQDESPERANEPEDESEVSDVSGERQDSDDDEMRGEVDPSSERDDGFEEEEEDPSNNSDGDMSDMSDIENTQASTAESFEGMNEQILKESNTLEENESGNINSVSSSPGANKSEDEFITPSSSRENSPSPKKVNAHAPLSSKGNSPSLKKANVHAPSSSRENSQSPKKAKTSKTRKPRLSMRDSDDSDDEKNNDGQNIKLTTRSQSKLKQPTDNLPTSSRSAENNRNSETRKSSKVRQESSGKQNSSNMPVDLSIKSSGRKTRSLMATASDNTIIISEEKNAARASIEGSVLRSQTTVRPTNVSPNNSNNKVSSKGKLDNITQMLKKKAIHLKASIDSKKNRNRREVDEEETNPILNTSKDQISNSDEHHVSACDQELMEISNNIGETSEIMNRNQAMDQSSIKDKGSNLKSFPDTEQSGMNMKRNVVSSMVSESPAFKPTEQQPMNTDESAVNPSATLESATKAHKRPYKEMVKSFEGEEVTKASTQNVHPKSGMPSNIRNESEFFKRMTLIPQTGVVEPSPQASQSISRSPNETHKAAVPNPSPVVSNRTPIPSAASRSSTITSASNRTETSPRTSVGSSSSVHVTQTFKATPVSTQTSPAVPSQPSVATPQSGFPAIPSPISVATPQSGFPAIPSPTSAATLQSGFPAIPSPISVATPQSGFSAVPSPTSVATPHSGSQALNPIPTSTLTASGPNHMIFTLMDGYHMSVNLGDITSERTEVIVNSTDSHLNHAGSLSRMIAAASGPNMFNECQQILFNRQKPLEVGDVVHTSAGGLLMNVKHLVHVVPPMGSNGDNDLASVKKLTHSYLQCCRYADLKLNCSSIAFPLLGSGSFSPDVSINCFYNAVLVFLSDRTPLSHLIDIRLIINDYDLHRFTVDYLGCCYENILTQGIDASMAEAINGFYGNHSFETQRSLVGAFFAAYRSPAGNSGTSSSNSTNTDDTTQNLFRGPAIKRPRL